MHVTKDTPLIKGLQLSKNVNLDAMTNGEHRRRYPRRMWGSASDPFPEVITEGLEKWEIVINMQKLAEEIVDPLVDRFGPQLKIFRGYQNTGDNTDKHSTGEAVDLFIPKYSSNMYHQANDMLDIIQGKFVEFGLIYGNMSWIHIGINGTYSPNPGDIVNPDIRSVDMGSGYTINGIVPLRGIAIR